MGFRRDRRLHMELPRIVLNQTSLSNGRGFWWRAVLERYTSLSLRKRDWVCIVACSYAGGRIAWAIPFHGKIAGLELSRPWSSTSQDMCSSWRSENPTLLKVYRIKSDLALSSTVVLLEYNSVLLRAACSLMRG